VRVLILAEECNPAWPSLPLVGYNTCRALAERVDVVVATHVRNRPSLSADPLGRAEVVFIDNEYIARPMYRAATRIRGGDAVNWTANVAMAYPPYLAFEREVWKRFRGDLRAGRFDVVHRVTPMSPTIPSPLARWSPVPFVLGPLNGGLPWPAEFQAELRREREWLTYLREAYRVLPYYRSTYRRAAAILAAFPHTIRDLPPEARARAIDFPEVGIDPDRFHSARNRIGQAPLTFLFVGRLVPYKCADVAIRAFAKSQCLRSHRLMIVGDGPERGSLEALVRAEGLESAVSIVGAVPQDEVARAMREADVFVFPSIRELGAGVVVEAMACGLPCVVTDYGGPGGLIDGQRGIKVRLGRKGDLVVGFRSAIESLAKEAKVRERLGVNAQNYALREYAWSAKASKIVQVYEWVLGRRRDRPSFDACGTAGP
jgi:glycosyltransferase involved in cell wall biosynthesis